MQKLIALSFMFFRSYNQRFHKAEQTGTTFSWNNLFFPFY
ncbi:hypothetical protein M23134_03053 [Microscilla marina ATCC 23134]|uniref:Uncharacterized protein n=1 Tax=Microscilla marina ATCC 23134 TaxID=313606 RepID=A1ZZ98_MICM2|nr:hypothetical protein M23134_03053 [Microscilla marina ATCC 23134]